MKTKKIVIEVIWKPTEAMRNPSILADDLTDAARKAVRAASSLGEGT